MKNLKNICKVSAIVVLTTVCVDAIAADWTIKQTATITTATPNLGQGVTALVSNSTQAINGIALESTADSLVAGSQLSMLSVTDLSLVQGDKVTGSRQAVNYIAAKDVGGTAAANTVTQTVASTASSATTLEQKVAAAGGASNFHALNMTQAKGVIKYLTQAVTESGGLNLTQTAVTTEPNTHGVNYASGTTIGEKTRAKLSQTLMITDATTFTQNATGGENVQGGNIAEATSGKLDNASQTGLLPLQ